METAEHRQNGCRKAKAVAGKSQEKTRAIIGVLIRRSFARLLDDIVRDHVDGSGKMLRVFCYSRTVVDRATWRWWLLEGMDHSIAERINPLELPITVLASKDDPVMTTDVIEQRVMRVLNRAKLVVTRKVGHLIPLEAPDWVAEQIRRSTSRGR